MLLLEQATRSSLRRGATGTTMSKTCLFRLLQAAIVSRSRRKSRVTFASPRPLYLRPQCHRRTPSRSAADRVAAFSPMSMRCGKSTSLSRPTSFSSTPAPTRFVVEKHLHGFVQDGGSETPGPGGKAQHRGNLDIVGLQFDGKQRGRQLSPGASAQAS